MRKEYIQPFLKAAETIAEQYFGIPVLKSSISLEDTLALEKDFIMAIGLRGQIKGIVVFGLSSQEAERLRNQALLLQGMHEDSDFAKSLSPEDWEKIKKSALLEFSNQVTGYVTQLYENENIICDITEPTTLESKQLQRYQKESVRFEVKNKLANIVMKLYIQ